MAVQCPRPELIADLESSWPRASAAVHVAGHFSRFQIGTLPDDLQPWVERWNETTLDEQAMNSMRMLRVTRASPALWYRIESNLPDSAAQPGRLLVTGVFDQSSWVPIDRSHDNILFFLRPGAARAVLGKPAEAFANCRMTAREVFGDDGRQLEERLAALTTRIQRRELMAQFIRTRLYRYARPVDRELVDCIRQMRHPLSLHTLREPHGWSSRQLERLCAAGVGMGLKRLSVLLRAGDAMRQACTLADPHWSELAADHGFYDQSHLTHAISSVFGQTPARFHREVRAGAQWVDGMITFPGRVAS